MAERSDCLLLQMQVCVCKKATRVVSKFWRELLLWRYNFLCFAWDLVAQGSVWGSLRHAGAREHVNWAWLVGTRPGIMAAGSSEGQDRSWCGRQGSPETDEATACQNSTHGLSDQGSCRQAREPRSPRCDRGNAILRARARVLADGRWLATVQKGVRVAFWSRVGWLPGVGMGSGTSRKPEGDEREKKKKKKAFLYSPTCSELHGEQLFCRRRPDEISHV